MQISNIIQGWNSYFKNITESYVFGRALECEQCPEAVIGTYEKFMPDNTLKKIQGLKCNQCGCPLSTKLRSKKENCPLGKW